MNTDNKTKLSEIHLLINEGTEDETRLTLAEYIAPLEDDDVIDHCMTVQHFAIGEGKQIGMDYIRRVEPAFTNKETVLTTIGSDELGELLESTTKGKWEFEKHDPETSRYFGNVISELGIGDHGIMNIRTIDIVLKNCGEIEAEANARLLALSPQIAKELIALRKENEMLRKEMESWKKENFDNVEMAAQTIKEIQSENEQLRSALERIKNVYDNVEDFAGVVAKEALLNTKH